MAAHNDCGRDSREPRALTADRDLNLRRAISAAIRSDRRSHDRAGSGNVYALVGVSGGRDEVHGSRGCGLCPRATRRLETGLKKLRATCRRDLKGYTEAMEYGMPAYSQLPTGSAPHHRLHLRHIADHTVRRLAAGHSDARRELRSRIGIRPGAPSGSPAILASTERAPSAALRAPCAGSEWMQRFGNPPRGSRRAIDECAAQHTRTCRWSSKSHRRVTQSLRPMVAIAGSPDMSVPSDSLRPRRLTPGDEILVHRSVGHRAARIGRSPSYSRARRQCGSSTGTTTRSDAPRPAGVTGQSRTEFGCRRSTVAFGVVNGRYDRPASSSVVLKRVAEARAALGGRK